MIISNIIYIRWNLHYQKIAKNPWKLRGYLRWIFTNELQNSKVGTPSPFAVLRSATSNVRHWRIQSSIAIHAKTIDSPRITYPFVPLMCTQLSLSPDKLHRKILRGREIFSRLSNATLTRIDVTRDRGFTDPACPRGRKSERGRNTPIAFHGPLRGSHVHRGGSGDVGVASSAYVTCAPCARCDATRRRRRRHRVLVDAIANGTDTLIERCVSTRKESNPRGLGLYEQTYSARKLLDKFRIIKFVHKMLLLNSALSCSPP